MNERLKKIYRIIGRNSLVSDNFLAIYRIYLGFHLGYFAIFQTPKHLGSLPNSFFQPSIFSIAQFFDNFPNPIFFLCCQIILFTCSFLIILGFYCKISFLFSSCILVMLNSLIFSLGKIDHNIMFLFLIFIFTFLDSENEYSLKPSLKFNRNNFFCGILALVLSFGLFTAGFEKALNWIDFDLNTSGVLSWHLQNYYINDRTNLLASYFPLIPPILMEIVDYTAAIFEISALAFLIKGKKTWNYYLILLSVFHLLNTVFLNISFTAHIYVIGFWLLSHLKTKPLIILLTLIFFLTLFKSYMNELYINLLLWSIIVFSGIIKLKRDKLNLGGI
ncbi:hypothetical protein [Zunongwangia atlantica]|uniref:HTTM-like domain-containing protein n=1 Tax=Zunongwangia atlantica 22II14-10F7 TaxID=1185767 RepID=A0A1Y1SYD3_9FLAO|nr:hypothetical protein [Zunongwangia atlantica]ORL43760.1 hypothetical protein IIF7_18949 [Zunongwangia atlantica 22II14-10F7]